VFFFLPVATTALLSRRPWTVYSLVGLCLAFLLIEFYPPALHWMDVHLVFRPSDANVVASLGSSFMHAGLFHLTANMLVFYLFGAAVECRLGWWRFLVLYFVAAMSGDLLYTLLCPEYLSHVGSVGASGAIYGVLAAYLVSFRHTKVRALYLVFLLFYLRAGVAEISAAVVIVGYALLDLLWMLLSGMSSEINYAAHLGGFIAGLGLAFILLRTLPRTEEDEAEEEEPRAPTPPAR